MRPRLRLLLTLLFACIGSTAIEGLRTSAQPPGGSSRSDSDSRDRYRGRSSDRSRGDWRSSRSRGDEERREEDKREDERPSSATSTSGSSSSSRSTSSSTPAPTTAASTSSAESAPSIDLKKWATALVTKNDKNGNMILEPEEQSALGSSATSYDLNRDGKITIDEIVMHHSPGAATAKASVSAATPTASSGSPSVRSGSGGSGDGHSKADDGVAKRVLTGTAGGTGKDADKRRSYRFSKATDKLPTGLPSWFTSRDTNRDGQVSMSEYSRTVSQSMVAEFRRYDANDDGIITAKEAAKHK